MKQQWTVIAIDRVTGVASKFQIGWWDMVWNSQRSAERIVKEYTDPNRPYSLKAVPDQLCAWHAYNQQQGLTTAI